MGSEKEQRFGERMACLNVIVRECIEMRVCTARANGQARQFGSVRTAHAGHLFFSHCCDGRSAGLMSVACRNPDTELGESRGMQGPLPRILVIIEPDLLLPRKDGFLQARASGAHACTKSFPRSVDCGTLRYCAPRDRPVRRPSPLFPFPFICLAWPGTRAATRAGRHSAFGSGRPAST